MIAYKLVRENSELKYVTGNTYTLQGEKSDNQDFFDFYSELSHVIEVPFSIETYVLVEVEILGECVEKFNDEEFDMFEGLLPKNTISTNKFKVLSIIPKEEYKNVFNGEKYRFDDRGNLLHLVDYSGNEEHMEYDDFNNLIHKKSSEDNYELWKEYNKQGLVTYIKDTKGLEIRCEYDENGNCTYYKSGDKEYRKTYDKDNNLISYKDNNSDYSIIIESQKES